MIKKIIKIILNIINFLFIILTIGLIFISIFKKEWIEVFINFMENTINNIGFYNYIIALISSFIEAFPVIGMLLPGQNILLIVGGFFGSIGTINLVFVIIIASIGAILGNHIGFILGKYYGEEFLKKYGIWIGLGNTELNYLKKGINKWGAIGITFGKFHPLTRSFLPFIAGNMGMNSKKFIFYNAIGSTIRATSITLLGVVFVNFYKILIDNSGKISFGIILSIIIFIYFFKKEKFLKYWKEKNEELNNL